MDLAAEILEHGSHEFYAKFLIPGEGEASPAQAAAQGDQDGGGETSPAQEGSSATAPGIDQEAMEKFKAQLTGGKAAEPAGASS